MISTFITAINGMVCALIGATDKIISIGQKIDTKNEEKYLQLLEDKGVWNGSEELNIIQILEDTDKYKYIKEFLAPDLEKLPLLNWDEILFSLSKVNHEILLDPCYIYYWIYVLYLSKLGQLDIFSSSMGVDIGTGEVQARNLEILRLVKNNVERISGIPIHFVIESYGQRKRVVLKECSTSSNIEDFK